MATSTPPNESEDYGCGHRFMPGVKFATGGGSRENGPVGCQTCRPAPRCIYRAEWRAGEAATLRRVLPVAAAQPCEPCWDRADDDDHQDRVEHWHLPGVG
jgi:hypothetical protein